MNAASEGQENEAWKEGIQIRKKKKAEVKKQKRTVSKRLLLFFEDRVYSRESFYRDDAL